MAKGKKVAPKKSLERASKQIENEFIKNKEKFAAKTKRAEETAEKIKMNQFIKKFGRPI